MCDKNQNIYILQEKFICSKFIVQLVKKSNLIEIQDQHRKCSIHWSSLIKIQLRRKTLMVSFSANQKRRLRTSLRVVGFRYLCPLGCSTQLKSEFDYRIVASRSTSRLMTPHLLIELNSIHGASKNKTYLKFCEDSWNSKSFGQQTKKFCS